MRSGWRTLEARSAPVYSNSLVFQPRWKPSRDWSRGEPRRAHRRMDGSPGLRPALQLAETMQVRVLVADDQSFWRKALEESLLENGHRVIVAESGA